LRGQVGGETREMAGLVEGSEIGGEIGIHNPGEHETSARHFSSIILGANRRRREQRNRQCRQDGRQDDGQDEPCAMHRRRI
jgi:hypothetical protein